MKKLLKRLFGKQTEQMKQLNVISNSSVELELEDGTVVNITVHPKVKCNVYYEFSTREQNIEISGNTAIAYEPFLAAGISEIPVYGSEAVWIQNPNYPNNYALVKKEYVMGKSRLHDKTKFRIFGWTEEVAYGDKKR